MELRFYSHSTHNMLCCFVSTALSEHEQAQMHPQLAVVQMAAVVLAVHSNNNSSSR
jgi:hypothetical protein